MSNMKMISLYTGAGGLDYGFEMAGFSNLASVEMDHYCCETMRMNRDWSVLERNIHDVSNSELMDIAGVARYDTKIVIGGPPCQPFSKSGYWSNGDTKRLDDPRAKTLDAFMRCVDDLLPEVFLFENVHGISYSGKEEGFRFIENEIARINIRHETNYVYSWKVLDAVEFGVPQKRKRFFLVAHRDGQLFEFPNPSHGITEGNFSQELISQEALSPYVTTWDAIGGYNPPEEENLNPKGKWAELLPSIPEGENYLWHTKRGGGKPLFGWRTRYWSFLLKLAKNLPSWTIQAQPGPAVGPFHWKSRLLSIKEMSSLQTFPKDIQFSGSRREIQKQIGNAVPSLLAEVLARSIAEQYFDRKKTSKLKLAVDLKKPIPPPELVLPVHEKYLNLVGDYADHPGTGKGPGVKNRK